MGPSLTIVGRRVAVTDPAYRLGKAPANKGRKFPPQPLTETEVFALLDACSPRSATGLRHRALIVVMWRAGLRVAEALDLHPSDVDLVVGTITVRHGKGDRHRVVGVDPQAAAVIARWMDCRKRLGVSDHRRLFCKIRDPGRGKAMRTAQVRETLAILARRAGITKRVHPHGLRHTHAFELAKENTPLVFIQKQLGHARVDTTARYVDHLAPMEVVARMQARRWPSNDHDEASAIAAASTSSS